MKSKIEIFNTTDSPTWGPTGDAVKTLFGDELFGDVTYYKSLNAGVDLQLGQVSSAQVQFTTTYSSINKDQCFKYYTWQECDSDYRLVDVYYVNDIVKDVNFYTITGYDCVSKLDKDCTTFLKTTNASTLFGLLSALCTYCKISLFNGTVAHNASMPVVPSQLATAGITARTVMGYIAEAAGCFIYSLNSNNKYGSGTGNSSGNQIWCQEYITQNKNITSADYSYLNIADQDAPQVTAVNMQLANDNSVRPSAGTSAEYNILYNPFFYNRTKEIVKQYVLNIYSAISAIGAYRPATVKCFSDLKIDAGEKITINNLNYIVMSKKITNAGCEFTCTGNPSREPLVQQNTDRITNLEANKGNENYLTEQWFNSGTYKDFLGQIGCTDIIMPFGLGYPNNTSNTSLVSVISALVAKAWSTTPSVIMESFVLKRRTAYSDRGSTSYTSALTWSGSYTYSYSIDATTYSGLPTGISATNNGGYLMFTNTGYSNSKTITVEVMLNGDQKGIFSIICPDYYLPVGGAQPYGLWNEPSSPFPGGYGFYLFSKNQNAYVAQAITTDGSNNYATWIYDDGSQSYGGVVGWAMNFKNNTYTSIPDLYTLIVCDNDHLDPSLPTNNGTIYIYVEA